jgi:UDP-3-O-[3-hydroxymyristoyl] glucosamine N-acyltransferase LpxD
MKGDSVPTIGEVVDFLRDIGETTAPLVFSLELASTRIRGLQTDEKAGPGDMAWISPVQVRRVPERLRSFRGSLLICSEDPPADGETDTCGVRIRCRHPRLAFIKTARQFFMGLAATDWPESPDSPVHPSSTLGPNVRLCAGAVIGSNVSIKGDVLVGPNSCIANCSIASDVVIGANCSIGLPGFGYEKDEQGSYWRFPNFGRVVVEEGVEIGSNTCIDRGSIGDTLIGKGSKIDNLVHIAHNVVIAENSIIIAHAMLGGSTRLAEGVWVAPCASLINHISVGSRAMIGMGAVVLRDVEPGSVMVGNPARRIRTEERT